MSADQRRLAAALSAAGLSDRQVMLEVLLMMPQKFIDEYEKVYLAAFGSGAMRQPENPRVGVQKNDVRLSTSRPDRVGGVGVSKKTGSGTSPLHSGRALSVKVYADRKLRSLARDIANRMDDGSDSLPRRCAGRCKRWADPEWLYCPNCGGPTETVDPN